MVSWKTISAVKSSMEDTSKMGDDIIRAFIHELYNQTTVATQYKNCSAYSVVALAMCVCVKRLTCKVVAVDALLSVGGGFPTPLPK